MEIITSILMDSYDLNSHTMASGHNLGTSYVIKPVELISSSTIGCITLGNIINLSAGSTPSDGIREGGL
jgi:hypothetical protein